MSWTAPRTWVTGETLTSTLLNTHLRDNLLTLGGAIGAAYAPAAANTDLAAPTNWMHPVAPTAAGWSIRSIAAAPQAGQRLVLRNTAAFVLTLLHATAGGTGAQLNLRGAANSVLAQFDAAELIYDGTTWNEIGRDQAIAYAGPLASTAITSGAAGYAAVALGTALLTSAGLTVATPNVTPPVGVYAVIAQGTWGVNTSGHRRIAVAKGGTVIYEATMAAFANTTSASMALTAAGVLSVTGAETISAMAYQESGSTLNISGNLVIVKLG